MLQRRKKLASEVPAEPPSAPSTPASFARSQPYVLFQRAGSSRWWVRFSMRPTEIKNLNWGDVLGYREGRGKPLGQRDIRLRVRGKGKSRTFVPMPAALPWFDNLWEFWVKAKGSAPTDADPVFATPTGKRLGSVKKSLSELLKAADLLWDHRGERRTSYSFRHFYISQQIIAGVEVFLLAKNTGTSSDMIERFYADVKLERMTKELRPEWRSRE